MNKRYTKKEAAEFLAVSEATINAYQANGILSKPGRQGRKVTFSYQELVRAAKQLGKEVDDDFLSPEEKQRLLRKINALEAENHALRSALREVCTHTFGCIQGLMDDVKRASEQAGA